MKCPKCGFVSYPGLTQCKRCGHKFVAAAPKSSGSSLVSLFSGSTIPSHEPPPAPSTPPPPPPELLHEAAAVAREAPPPETAIEDVPPAASAAKPASSSHGWREEISQRVEDFRRRRARLRGFDPSASLALDFDSPGASEPETVVGAQVIEFPGHREELDLDMASHPARDREAPVLDSVPLGQPPDESREFDSVAVGGELALERAEADHAEIVLESVPPSTAAYGEPAMPALPIAPLGRRFLAGLVDAAVLLLGAGLFALIFWRAGGFLSLGTVNLVILVAMTAFFVIAYFGVFTALISTTPGLLWMGLEVRNFEGSGPTPQESFWRASGYLVSALAFLLGFIWALVDSDRLTWHDRMSGTFISTTEGARRRARLSTGH